jgi:hypothetical protein
MSWDAGAITGQIILETGQYTGPIQHAIGQAVQAGAALGHLDTAAHQAGSGLAAAAPSAEHAAGALREAGHAAEEMHGGLLHALGVMEMFRVASEVAFELPLELVRKAFETAKEAVERFFDSIAEVGDVAQKMGLDALKAGVDVKFFSEISEAAKRVGIDADQLGQSFKFLQKNAVDALTGLNQDAMAGFAGLGISTQFLKENLNNTEAIFGEVKDRLGELPDAAERTRIAMQILGRAGSDMIPLFVQSNEQMQESIDLATRLGAVEDESSTEGAEGWVKAKAAFSDMWEGISRAVAEPVLEYLTEHWADVREAMISFTDATIEAMPTVMSAIVGAMDPVLAVLQEVIKNVAGLAELWAYLGGVHTDAGVHLMSLAGDLDRLRNGLDEVTASSERFRQHWRERGREMDGGFDTGMGGPRTVHNHVQVNLHEGSGAREAGEAVTRELLAHQRKSKGTAARGHVARASGGKAAAVRLFDDYR